MNVGSYPERLFIFLRPIYLWISLNTLWEQSIRDRYSCEYHIINTTESIPSLTQSSCFRSTAVSLTFDLGISKKMHFFFFNKILTKHSNPVATVDSYTLVQRLTVNVTFLKYPLSSCPRWGEDDLPSCLCSDRPGGPTSGAAPTCSCSSGPQQGDEPLQRTTNPANVTRAALLR